MRNTIGYIVQMGAALVSAYLLRDKISIYFAIVIFVFGYDLSQFLKRLDD